MHITHPPLSRPNTITSITQILNSLNIAQFVIVSHSYRTVVATYILHDAHLSTRVAARLFIDPIPFLLHLRNIVTSHTTSSIRTLVPQTNGSYGTSPAKIPIYPVQCQEISSGRRTYYGKKN